MPEIKIYGIRHHGAGSTRNLISALHSFRPDLILIECPSDANEMIQYVREGLIVPPAAIMIYNPGNLKQYAYYPFTVFSPEWQSMLWAMQQDIPFRYFDLPESQCFLLSDTRMVTRQEEGLILDPFSHMAELSGYSDPERWWEEYIEYQRDAPQIFDLILTLMTEMRQVDRSEKYLTHVREAFMRNQIRRALKEGFQRIAVVCGAWHGPMLTDLQKPGTTEDNKLLKGLKKVPVVSTWVPWSYNRISLHSGYQSGVISPYWYEALFIDPENAVARWMTYASGFIKELGYSTSPAHSIEAARLAEVLSYLRNKKMPGLNELFDSVTAVFTQGNEDLVDKLKYRLLEGDRIGQVADSVPVVPLMKDIELQLRQVRLFRDWKKTGLISRHLDLRKPNQLEASRFLHRLSLLGITWAILKDYENNPLGNFHEYWDLDWYPEYELQIVEANVWGNTVESAVISFIGNKITDEITFDKLGTLLHQVLRAQLPELVSPVCRKMANLGSTSYDVLALLQMMSPLLWSLRYGDTAKIDTTAIHQLIQETYPRLNILLPAQTQFIKEEVAREFFDSMSQFHQALQISQEKVDPELWIRTLFELIEARDTHPLLKGNSLRLLLLAEKLDEFKSRRHVHFALSGLLADPFYPAYFLEGLLHTGGGLLTRHRSLRELIDKWLNSLPEEIFTNYLPILRRTFSTFTVQEKQWVYAMLFSKRSEEEIDRTVNLHRKELILHSLRKLFSNDLA